MKPSASEQEVSFLRELRAAIPSQLPAYLAKQRWFGGKARQIRSSELVETIPFREYSPETLFLLVRVEYEAGSGETYFLPMFCQAETASSRAADPDSAFLTLHGADEGTRFVLTEALQSQDVLSGLLRAIDEKCSFKGRKGEIRCSPTGELRYLLPASGGPLTPKLLKGEQSNNSIVFGESVILKIFRRADAGLNPDLEMGLFLTEKVHFKNIPPLGGWMEYVAQNGPAATIGILQGFVPNHGDAWRFTLQHLGEFRQEIFATSTDPPRPSTRSVSGPSNMPQTPSISSLNAYLKAVALLAKRTAEMHQALSSDSSDAAFAPEPYSAQFQDSLENSIHALTRHNFALLRRKKTELPDETRSVAEEVIGREAEIFERIHSSLSSPISGMRIRIHGDYHLGQVLFTGSDFMIIDFEGEPARSLEERRTKRSALQDVAGMLRSFEYAAFASWMAPAPGATRPNVAKDRLIAWAEAWAGWVSSRFLASYLEQSGQAAYLPSGHDRLIDLLRLHILEKAIYELGYELNNRPAWVGIPLAGISALINS